jgi:hypothetical protein
MIIIEVLDLSSCLYIYITDFHLSNSFLAFGSNVFEFLVQETKSERATSLKRF